MEFVRTLQAIIAQRMASEEQQGQAGARQNQRGIFGRRSPLPQPLNSFASLAGISPGYEPGNPYGQSLGDFPNANGYSPPSYGDDLQLSGAPRAPLGSVLAPPQAWPQVNGMGGPEVMRGLEPPSAPAAPSMSAQENQAFREARQRAQEAIGREGYPTFRSESMVRAGNDLASAVEAARAARAERQRREGVTFDQWWHFGGRQDPSQHTANDPAFRFSRPPSRPTRR